MSEGKPFHIITFTMPEIGKNPYDFGDFFAYGDDRIWFQTLKDCGFQEEQWFLDDGLGKGPQSCVAKVEVDGKGFIHVTWADALILACIRMNRQDTAKRYQELKDTLLKHIKEQFIDTGTEEMYRWKWEAGQRVAERAKLMKIEPYDKLMKQFTRSIFEDYEEMMPMLLDRIFNEDFINETFELWVNDTWRPQGTYVFMIDRIIKVLSETKECVIKFGDYVSHKCIQNRLGFSDDNYETPIHPSLDQLKLKKYTDLVKDIFPVDDDYKWSCKVKLWSILKQARDDFYLDDKVIEFMIEKYPKRKEFIDELKDHY